MGGDPDARWVQWLALSRCNNPASLSSVVSSPSSLSTSSLPMACSNLQNSGSGLDCLRSNATNYYALLSAAKDQDHRQDTRSSGKQHYNSSSIPVTSRHMDSSWVAWLHECRGGNCSSHRQRQGGGGEVIPGELTTQSANANGTGHEYYGSGPSRCPSEPSMQPPLLHSNNTISPPSAFPDTSPFSTTTTTPLSMTSSAATSFFSALTTPLTNTEMDALSEQFPDLSADGSLLAGFPEDTATTDGDEMMLGGPFDPDELDAAS